MTTKEEHSGEGPAEGNRNEWGVFRAKPMERAVDAAPVASAVTPAPAVTSVPQQADEKLWTVAEVAAHLQVSKSWVYQAARKLAIPSVKVGASVRFRPTQIFAWAAGTLVTGPQR